MTSFNLFLSLLPCLSLLFNIGRIYGKDTKAPNITPSKYLDEFYIDNFDLLKKLAWSDLRIVKVLIQGVEHLQKESEEIPSQVETYIEDFKRGNEEIFKKSWKKWTKKTAKLIAKNPISTYRLLYRYVKDLSDLITSDLDPIFDKIQDAVLPDLFEWLEYEGQLNLDYAARGILNLQHVYGVSAEQVGRGEFPLINLHGQLDSKHCYSIGLRALALDFLSEAVEWFELALEKAEMEGMDEIDQERILVKLESAIFHHDEVYQNDTSGLNPHLFDKPLKSTSESAVNRIQRKTRRELLSQKFRGSRNWDNLEITRLAICRGENYQTEEEKRHLFCWYESEAHAKFRIGPLKMEFMSQNPDIVMIYDFLGNSTINKILKSRKDKRTRKQYSAEDPRALAQRSTDYPGVRGNGKYNWIWDGPPTPDFPSFDILSVTQNVEALLDINLKRIEESELLYIRSYTWSSGTKLHLDFHFILSVIHYLTDVDIGGYTAFPAAGLALKPVKGAAAIWFNQLRDLEKNHYTKHQSCPVLFGTKAVATKFINDTANILKLNCARQKGQQFIIKVNGKDFQRPKRKISNF